MSLAANLRTRIAILKQKEAGLAIEIATYKAVREELERVLRSAGDDAEDGGSATPSRATATDLPFRAPAQSSSVTASAEAVMADDVEASVAAMDRAIIEAGDDGITARDLAEKIGQPLERVSPRIGRFRERMSWTRIGSPRFARWRKGTSA